MKKENDGVEITGKVKNPEIIPTQDAGEMSDKDRIAKLEKDIEILREASRQDRLIQADEHIRGKKSKYRTGFLKKLHGKVIVKWFSINEPGSKAKQELIYQNTNVVNERLIGHYIAIDGEEISCDSVEFTRSTDLEKFDITGKNGGIYTIKFHNPELANAYPAYVISKKFINP